MLTKVGKLLRTMRLEKNEILKDMASKLGVTSAFISAIENGKKKMPASLRDKLVDQYGLSDSEIEKLDNAILESNDSVEISIRSLTDERKELAVSFARTFSDFNDDDIKFFIDY